ncbi:MAG: GTP cyclohydrolase I, partial [Aquiluna sp.]
MQPDRIRKAVLEILEAIGEDPARPELAQTPQKVADAYESFFSGIGKDPLSALTETFIAESPEAVLLKDIELVSICEHHLLPFTGVAHIAYLPSEKVAGLGRLANVVE